MRSFLIWFLPWFIPLLFTPILAAWVTGQPLTGLARLKGLAALLRGRKVQNARKRRARK